MLVGIHGEIGAPNHETPDRGALEISVEVSALAGPRFSGRTAEDAGE